MGALVLTLTKYSSLSSGRATMLQPTAAATLSATDEPQLTRAEVSNPLHSMQSAFARPLDDGKLGQKRISDSKKLKR